MSKFRRSSPFVRHFDVHALTQSCPTRCFLITEIACKWPEVDFRRAKTGEAAKTRKKSPPGPSSQRSPESVVQHFRDEPAGQSYARLAPERGASSMLLASHSISVAPYAPVSVVPADPSAFSPSMSRDYRHRTHSDGDRDVHHTGSAMHTIRSPTERYLHSSQFSDSRSASYGHSDSHTNPYSSAGVPDARHDQGASWMRDDRAQYYSQDHRPAWEQQTTRPPRAVPESRSSRTNSAVIRCRNRAAEISILARPAIDAQRIAAEAHMRRESSLEDLADDVPAGERLDHAFASDWDAIGGLSPAARRPFMDVAAGLVGVLEITSVKAQQDVARTPAGDASRLHLFRLRNSSDTGPDLRHLSISMGLSPRQERELLEAATSASYNTLSYPIPVDRLSIPLIDGVKRALDEQALEAEKSRSAGAHAPKTLQPHAASPPPPDSIPFVRKQDVKPPQQILEMFFQAYVKAIGDQMPGLDTKVVASRIRDGTVSPLLANALCAIGASLHERVGQRPSIDEALSSKVYLERARALIGAALQNPDLEAILALGVMAIRDILMGQIVSSTVIVASAIRLCMQLNLHRAQPAQRSPSPASATSVNAGTDFVASDVFWMIYCLDRVTSIATGQPLAIKDEDFDTAFPAAMRNGEPCIFAALVRQLHYLGRLAEVAVSTQFSASTALVDASDRARAREREISAIGADLIGHYESLPAVLQLGSTNLRRAHERGEALSFLQLHLTHNMALLHRFLLPSAVATNANYDAMRSAASEIVEIFRLGEALDPTMLADTPLSAIACFLSGCVLISEIEMLEESMQAAPGGDVPARSTVAQLEAAQSALARIRSTLSRHAELWPVARNLIDVLQAQQARSKNITISSTTIAGLVSQIEAIHVVVRRPEHLADRQRESGPPVQVRKVHDLELLRSAFPHLC